MGFSGNVTSMSLEEVFGFLAANALRGVLHIESGDDVGLRLYFEDGRIFFPFSGRRGTYNLGKILRHTGVLSRDGLGHYLEEQSARRQALRAQEEDSEEVRAAKRLQFTEEVHDLFLWGDARFEFRPGDWPVRIAADRDAGRGLVIDATSLLMEVARRADETRRIRQVIPSSRYMLRAMAGAEPQVVERLRAAKVEVESNPFDGSLSLDDLLTRWGIPHHEALSAVAELVEEELLTPLPAEQARAQVLELLHDGRDLAPVARLLGHWAELNARRGERLALDLEQELITSAAFVSGPEESTSLRLEGARVFTLLRALTSMGQPFTAVLHHRGWEKRVAGLPGELFVKDERRPDAGAPPLAAYLLRHGALDKDEAEQLAAASPDVLEARVPAEALARARLDRLADDLAEVVFWGLTDVELRNRSHRGPDPAGGVSVGLDETKRGWLCAMLERWAKVFRVVPGDDCLFVPGYGVKKAGDRDPAAKFFQRFSLQRNVGELRRKAQASRLEFAQFVARGLERGYLRSPTVEELRRAVQEAQEAANDIMAYRLAAAAAALGHGAEFQEVLDHLRREEAALPGPFPALEGDLDGVGLAALLQALQQHRRTGTLSVRAGRREERLYFSRGEAYVLRIEDQEADEFVAFFLGDEGAGSVSELGSGLARQGLVDESELSESEVKELKDSFLDILLGEDSTFSFFQNQLPDEFFNPDERVSKVRLNTQRFLLEAMQQVTEYEALCGVIGGGRSLLRFASAEAKLQAIQTLGQPEILTLVDGRLSFDDLVRISGLQRLDVARALRGLVEEGALERLGDKADPLEAIPDPTPDR